MGPMKKKARHHPGFDIEPLKTRQRHRPGVEEAHIEEVQEEEVNSPKPTPRRLFMAKLSTAGVVAVDSAAEVDHEHIELEVLRVRMCLDRSRSV